ncbi:hypothetical protein [Neobacillus sp. PS2-9]|uniref:hypothetical protein n=1 Tax=Neobacillus sp. PS2-9 TaxID=3070676 RepID=UPI0027E04F9C|nr:hypothetical protein [Neobacillus sp. PS2-9]WML56156.1 hypothetical protein RCG25_14565 [Neobacillus sp. PS2-9]
MDIKHYLNTTFHGVSTMKFLFKNRIKQIVIIQFLLLIPMFIIGFLVFRAKEGVDFFYLGIFQGIVALYWLVAGIENFILKKRGYSLIYFILTVMFILLSIETFHILNIKK